jgi:hypothetical protein
VVVKLLEDVMEWSDCKDEQVTRLTAKIDALRAEYQPLPNGEQRYTLHAECSELVAQRRSRFDGLPRD